MAGVLLPVSWISQRPSKNLCWWACARMLAAYRGRRISTPSILKKVSNNHKMALHCAFLCDAGFKIVPKPELPGGGQKSAGGVAGLAAWKGGAGMGAPLVAALNKYGPLLTLITWTLNASPDHAIVVRGTDGSSKAKICDPAGMTDEWSLDELANRIVYHCQTPMMYLP